MTNRETLRLSDFPIRAAHFATELRASSFLEALDKAGIPAISRTPRWSNKRLPPPRTEVLVKEADAAKAEEVFAAFQAGSPRGAGGER